MVKAVAVTIETTILHPWHGRDLGRTSSEKQAVRAGIHLQGSPPGHRVDHLGEGEQHSGLTRSMAATPATAIASATMARPSRT